MKTFRSMLALVMALCVMLTGAYALADQNLEGDANVDGRILSFIAPFYCFHKLSFYSG